MPVRTVLPVEESLLASDFLIDALLEDEEEEEEDTFQLFSLASSNSICSCLQSLLQNGVFPLYMKMSELFPSDFLQRKQASRK